MTTLTLLVFLPCALAAEPSAPSAAPASLSAWTVPLHLPEAAPLPTDPYELERLRRRRRTAIALAGTLTGVGAILVAPLATFALSSSVHRDL